MCSWTIGAEITDDHCPTAWRAGPLDGDAGRPSFPSLLAVRVADPAATPVTRPAADTVATWGASVAQVKARPGSGWPPASLAVALSCTVPPTGALDAAGATSTVATGSTVAAVTVTLAVPLCPSLVAVMIAGPAATPVTRPAADTVAT